MRDKLKQGEALFAEGRIEEAKECFTAILQTHPQSTEAYNNLGVIAFQNNEAEEAINNFRACLAIDPRHKDAVINIASLFKRLNHREAAIAILKDFDRRLPADEEIAALLREFNEIPGGETAPESPLPAEGKAAGRRDGTADNVAGSLKKETPWNSLWTQVKVEDILKEPSHQEIADSVIGHVGVNGRKVLDVGCGTGGTGMSLAQYGARMTLFDMSPDSLELSKRVFHHQGLKGGFVRGNMFSLPFADNSFDVVTSFGVLEHFPAAEIVQALKEMRRVSNGMVVTTVPNAQCAFYRIAKWYAEKTGTWQYGYEKPEYSMASYFQEAGFALHKEYSIGFIDSVAFLGRLPNAGPLQQISLEFNREHPNAVDGSLIISFGDKNNGAKASQDAETAKPWVPAEGAFTPLVSVLTCAWNAEKYIAETIRSILNQTYRNLELIVVDDGSTDNTRQVIAGFDDARIRYFYKQHSGLADSRNFSRSKAQGDYSVIIDSDDLIDPSLVEKEIQVFKENPNEYLVVYPNFELIRHDGQKTGTFWKYEDYRSAEIVPILFRSGKNVVPEPSMMIPKRLADEVGPYNTRLRDSDNEFIARLARYASKFISLKQPLYFYRRYEGNMSSGSMTERANSSLAMMEKMLEIYSPRELFPDIGWETLDGKAGEALFHLTIAELLLSHCRLYQQGDGLEPFLEKTILHLNKSCAADPANSRARSLAKGIVSLFPDSAYKLKAAVPGKAVVAVRAESFSSIRQPLRILYLADCRSQHTKRYVRFFKERGHEVHVFDTSLHTEGLQGIDLHFPPSMDASTTAHDFGEVFVHTVFELNRLIEEIKPDILHGHYLTLWCWWGAFTGFQPYVTTAWGSDIFLDAQNDFHRRFTNFCLKESPLVTADSRDLLEATGKLRGDKDGLEYIPFGIDMDFFRPGYDVDALAKRLGISGRKVVLSPRQFKPPSNIDIIIRSIPRVVARVPGTVFLLKTYLSDGSSFSEYQQSLREMVRKMRVQDHVRFIEDIDFAEMPILYNLTDVMVTLRDTDGSACSMLECMACKTPIVASDIESMREWITDGENGRLVDHHSPDAVADAIVDLLLNQEKKRKFVDASYQRVHERADYRKNWADVEALYYWLKAEGKRDRYRSRGFNGADVSSRYDALKTGWDLLYSREPDRAEKVFLQITGIDKLPMHLYLKASLGLAKAAWMKHDHDAARQHYLGCLKLIQYFGLDSHLDITR